MIRSIVRPIASALTRSKPTGTLGILTVGTNGTSRGYQEGLYGVMNPNTLEDETVFEFSADDTGACVLSLGDGTAQLLGVDVIRVEVEGFDTLDYTWNEATTQYEATSLDLFNYLDGITGFAIDLFYTPMAENLVTNSTFARDSRFSKSSRISSRS